MLNNSTLLHGVIATMAVGLFPITEPAQPPHLSDTSKKSTLFVYEPMRWDPDFDLGSTILVWGEAANLRQNQHGRRRTQRQRECLCELALLPQEAVPKILERTSAAVVASSICRCQFWVPPAAGVPTVESAIRVHPSRCRSGRELIV